MASRQFWRFHEDARSKLISRPYISTTKDIHNSLQNGRKIGAPHYKQACLLWEIRTGLCELKGCASYERHAAYAEYQKVREMILMRRTHIRMRAAKILI